jgi:molybdopterin-guanine dinucleotide biosynthesis protein A
VNASSKHRGGSIVGVILAGGRSQRMGGGDKCLQPLAGQSILAHVIARFAPQVSTLVINANGDPQRFANFGLPVFGDAAAGFAGPLAGVHAGLEWTRRHCPEASAIATVAADSPFFPPDLVARLAAQRDADNAILAVARSADGLHPVFGLWSVTLEDTLLRALRDGERKMTDWVASQGGVAVDFPAVKIGGRTVDTFFNINRAEDLAEAERLLKMDA